MNLVKVAWSNLRVVGGAIGDGTVANDVEEFWRDGYCNAREQEKH